MKRLLKHAALWLACAALAVGLGVLAAMEAQV